MAARRSVRRAGRLRNGEFDAIVVNPNVLMLGATFSGAAANTGDLFNPQPGVDPNRDVIRFATPDNFQTGDAVKYDAKGNTFISSGINETEHLLRPRARPVHHRALHDARRRDGTGLAVRPVNARRGERFDDHAARQHVHLGRSRDV